MGAVRPNRDAANPHDKPVIPRRRKATRLGCWKRSRPERSSRRSCPPPCTSTTPPGPAGAGRHGSVGPARTGDRGSRDRGGGAADRVGRAGGRGPGRAGFARRRPGLRVDGGHRTRRAAPRPGAAARAGGAMNIQEDLGAIARAIVDANLYMVLGTVDEHGRPWVSPVYYATADYTRFYWISSPEVRHSRNLAQRPHVSIVIFDSRVPAYTGQAVYMSAVAEELTGEDLDRG